MSDASRRAEAIVNRNLARYGRALGLEALRRLLQKTPVDTGHARGNWFVQPDRASDAQIEGRVEGVALIEGEAVVEGWDITRTELHLTNNVPYIERLENGYSRQAPQGMAKLTVNELKPVSDRIAARVARGG